MTGAFDNLDKNYYVEKTEITQAAYGVYANTKSGVISKSEIVEMTVDVLNAYVGEGNTLFNKSASLSDIPLEVIYE